MVEWLIIFVSVALIAVITVIVFRFFARTFGMEKVVEEGAALTENGLEFLSPFGLGKTTIIYANVESVELLPYYKGLFSIMLFRYGMSARWICTRFFSEIVVVKLREPRVFQHLLFTPKNPRSFVDELKSRIEQSRTSREYQKPATP
jgi:hypothetical protein